MNNPFTLLQDIHDDLRAIRRALTPTPVAEEVEDDPTLKKILKEISQGKESGWNVESIWVGHDLAFRCKLPPRWDSPYGPIRIELFKSAFRNYYSIHWRK